MAARALQKVKLKKGTDGKAMPPEDDESVRVRSGGGLHSIRDISATFIYLQ